MKLHSIRFKITAITVAAILVAIFAIVSASAPSTREEAERRSVETMRLIGENTKDKLNDYFSNVEQAVNLTANLAADSLDSLVLVECGAAGRTSALPSRPRVSTPISPGTARAFCTPFRAPQATPTGL